MVRCAYFLVAAALFFSTAAFADGGKEEFQKAVKYSKAGEYEAALPLFKKAYELSGHRSSTILALAQCERSLKLWDDAIKHFKEYLAVKPTPRDAKKVEETIALLEDIRAQQPKREPPPQPPPKEEPKVTPKVELAVKEPPPAPKKEPKQEPKQEAPKLVVETKPKQPPIEEETIFDSPIFWIVSGAVVVAAGGAAVGIALSGTEDPYGGTAGVTLHK